MDENDSATWIMGAEFEYRGSPRLGQRAVISHTEGPLLPCLRKDDRLMLYPRIGADPNRIKEAIEILNEVFGYVALLGEQRPEYSATPCMSDLKKTGKVFWPIVQ